MTIFGCVPCNNEATIRRVVACLAPETVRDCFPRVVGVGVGRCGDAEVRVRDIKEDVAYSFDFIELWPSAFGIETSHCRRGGAGRKR